MKLSSCETFFKDLLWPAVTGNVLWSIGSLIVLATQFGLKLQMAIHLLSLLLVLVYLIQIWELYSTEPAGSKGWGYLFLDGLFAIFITLFAISTNNLGAAQQSVAQFEASKFFGILPNDLWLSGTLLSGSIGHFSKVWALELKDNWNNFLGVSFLIIGVSVVFINPQYEGVPNFSEQVFAIILALAAWNLARVKGRRI
jgi:hypothetical protein